MYRQGELIFKKERVQGEKLPHLIIAEGEKTGNKHEITTGEAELYEHEGTLFLRAITDSVVTHPDHKSVTLPQGDYEIVVQREYEISEKQYRDVVD